MKRTPWSSCSIVVLGILVGLAPARSQTQCLFGEMGENVLVAFSMESWDKMWEMARAPGLGEELAVAIREELLPAILEEVGSATDYQSYLDGFDEISERIEWEGLAASRVDFISGWDSEKEPQFALRLTPPADKLGSVDDAAEEVLKFIANKNPESLKWKAVGEDRFLSMALSGEVEEASEIGKIYLTRREGSVWITLDASAEVIAKGPGLSAREGFSELWGMHPSQGGVSFVVDFGSLADLLTGFAEEFEPEVSSSLVLDETMEGLFKDDPETLEKLKQAQEGLGFWSEELGDDPMAAANKGIDLLGGLGILLYRSSPTEEGILSGTYWRPNPDSEHSALFALKPLSGRNLSLLETDRVEVGLSGLPDLGLLYDTVLDLAGSIPGSGMFLPEWEKMQDSIDFHLKKDLFPAIGREVGWVSRQVPKGGKQAFPIATNELYVFQEIGDASVAAALLGRLEELLTGQGIPAVHKKVGEASFTEVDTVFVGKAMWGLLEDPPVLVFLKGGSEDFLLERIDRYRSGTPGNLSEHPRWESLKSIWKENPNAVTLQNAGLVHNQVKGQLQGAQMMISMMGAGNPVVLAGMGLAMQVLDGSPMPDWYFRVDHVEGEVQVSRSLLLFPLEDKEN